MDLQKISEDIDYKLIPVDYDNSQAWEVRILRGTFTETVIRFGNVSLDGRGEDTCLKFNFMVSSSPDENAIPENIELQELASKILTDIIERNILTGNLDLKDIDD